MRKTSAMSLWRWFPWSFCCVKCRHICVKRILYEAHTHQYIYSSESRGYSRDTFTLLLFTSGSWPSIHKAAESLNALHKYIPWCCDYICLAQALKSWKISLGSALKCECRGFKLRMTNTAARCCILSQIDNKAWQLWRLAWEKEKSKKKKKPVCGSFADSSADFGPGGTLSKHGQNRVVHLKLLLFGQNCVLFLILLIFSKLWLSEMTWQVFTITVGLASTRHHRCNLKGNTAEFHHSQQLLILWQDSRHANTVICLHTLCLTEDNLF